MIPVRRLGGSQNAGLYLKFPGGVSLEMLALEKNGAFVVLQDRYTSLDHLEQSPGLIVRFCSSEPSRHYFRAIRILGLMSSCLLSKPCLFAVGW